MLVASHIKPWSHSNNEERLDKYNGLLLISNFDKAFDCRLITFSETGEIIVSDSLVNPEILGISTQLKVSLLRENQEYMEYHRSYVFNGA